MIDKLRKDSLIAIGVGILAIAFYVLSRKL